MRPKRQSRPPAAAPGFTYDAISLRRFTPWLGVGLLGAALPAAGQFALTMADDFRTYSTPPARTAPGPADPGYNLRLGPTQWSFAAGVSLGWTSNARVSSSGGSDSLLLSPSITANMVMPLAERASLSLGVTMGYTFYLTGDNSDLDGFYVLPTTRLSYSMFIGDVQLSFFNAITVSRFSFNDPTVGNDPTARTLGNTFGATASTMLYRTSLAGGFSQYNSWQLGGDAGGVGDTGSQTLWSQVGYQIFPELTAGLSGGVTWIHYGSGNQTVIDSGFQWNAGPFANWIITERMTAYVSFGYTMFTQEYLFGLPSSDTDSMYWTVGLSHDVSRLLRYTLSASHTISPNYFAGPTDAYNVTLGLAWRLIRDVSISTPFSYYNGKSINPYDDLGQSTGSQRFQTYATGISLGYPLADRLSSSLSYTFNYRTQDGSGGDYTVNGVILSLSYRF